MLFEWLAVRLRFFECPKITPHKRYDSIGSAPAHEARVRLRDSGRGTFDWVIAFIVPYRPTAPKVVLFPSGASLVPTHRGGERSEFPPVSCRPTSLLRIGGVCDMRVELKPPYVLPSSLQSVRCSGSSGERGWSSRRVLSRTCRTVCSGNQ